MESGPCVPLILRSLLSLHQAPTAVRLIPRHGFGHRRGLWAEVLLINLPLLVDDESHDTRIAPFLRPRHQGEAADHVAVDDIIVFAPGHMSGGKYDYIING